MYEYLLYWINIHIYLYLYIFCLVASYRYEVLGLLLNFFHLIKLTQDVWLVFFQFLELVIEFQNVPGLLGALLGILDLFNLALYIELGLYQRIYGTSHCSHSYQASGVPYVGL